MSLGEVLIMPNILRAQLPNGLYQLTVTTMKALKVDVLSQAHARKAPPENEEPPNKDICRLCPCKLCRKTKLKCKTCQYAIMEDHSTKNVFYFDYVDCM